MANTEVTGHVVDAVAKTGIPGLKVKAYDIDPFAIENQLGKEATTGSGGEYSIKYSPSDYRIWLTAENPDIEVRVFGAGGRLLHETLKKDGVTDTVLTIPDIEIHASNVRVPDPGPGDPDNSDQRKQDPYWLVTHTTLDPTNGTPVRLTSGNQIEWLSDGNAMFPTVNERARGGLPPRPVIHTPPPPPPPAAVPNVTSIKLINMAFDPKLVSHFTFPPNVDYKTVKSSHMVLLDRLANIFKKQADTRNVPVHVLTWEAVNFGNLLDRAFNFLDGADELREFFQGSNVVVGSFSSTQLLHVKFIVFNGQTAILVGSTMKQGYFGDTDHLLRDGQHGARGLMHDASLKVEGPCVHFIEATFSTIWSAHNPNPPAPATQSGPASGSNLSAVQVLRTLPGNVFTQTIPNAEVLPHGETGVLEAYQRAIMMAEEYIYIEDQYFNSEEIVNAIKARMIERTNLEVIILINPRPDIGGYHAHQTGLIQDLIAAGGNHRVAAFTMWSCDATNPRPEIAPVYVHSKVCIIDDRWVAIGTANVDGASMNARQWKIIFPGVLEEFLDGSELKSTLFIMLLPLMLTISLAGFAVPVIGPFMRDAARLEFARFTQHANPHRQQQPPRHPEIDLVLYDGIAGQPASGRVKELRDLLWTEHLGKAPPSSRPGTGWVKLWNDQATLFKDNIVAASKPGSPRTVVKENVLKWSLFRDYEANLKDVGVPTQDIDLKKSGKAMPFQITEAIP
jgi:PLD-like domain